MIEAFAREVVDVNRRRLRVLGPIMVTVHLVHMAVFQFMPRTAATPEMLRWRHDLVIAHALMVPVTGFLGVWVYRSGYDWLSRLMGTIVAAEYLVHGAVCTSIDQLTITSVTTYVSYCLGMAVILALSPRQAIVAYVLGFIALLIGMLTLSPADLVLLAKMPTCATITIVGIALAWSLWTVRKREFGQRMTIERQKSELVELNTRLEQRVQEQVGVIVTHANEVEQLNAQLQAQVRSRSSELSLALAKLAQQREQDGALKHGTVVGGRFTVEDVIGEGGMGAVYSGVDRSTGGRVAIKIVQATSSRTLDALRRFVREAGAAAAVTHPAVVRMLNVDISDDGLLFQVQELIDGEPLGRAARRPWSAPETERLGAVLLDALAAAHAGGVIHRDVKPDNVMLTHAAPGLKLLDFGIAQLYDAVSNAADAMTRTGMIVGTPAYMAPEQVRGVEVSDRADVYSAGVILFRLLSERHPFEAASAQEMMMSRVLGEAPDVREFQPSVPAPLAELVARCLKRAPGERPSAAQMARELAALADAAGAPRLEAIARAHRELDATAATSPRYGTGS
jgi:serine/threonine-protein kinase